MAERVSPADVATYQRVSAALRDARALVQQLAQIYGAGPGMADHALRVCALAMLALCRDRAACVRLLDILHLYYDEYRALLAGVEDQSHDR
jgi:hypothetical protein